MAPTDDAAPQLLHAAPARLVWRRRGAPGEGDVVAKVFVRGSRVDAERELAALQLARGPGVIEALDVVDDAAARRPCLRTRHLDGVDLDAFVAAEGALPAATACALLAPVAATLARLHGLRDPAAPGGLCHGDVKPKNLLRTATTTVLLDFEHARPIGAGALGDGPRGTAGFAAPEAAAGAAPAAALDVYGLGATLDWLLGGGVPGAVPRAPAVAILVAACTATDAAMRPAAAEVASRLRELAAALPADPAEATLADWTSGRCERAPADTEAAAAEARIAPWRRRQRLVQRRPHLLQPSPTLPATPTALAAAFAANAAALRRMPRHAGLLAHRGGLANAIARRLATAAADVAALQRQDEHDAALAWLDGLERAVQLALAAPGGLRRVAAADDGAAAAAGAPLDLLRALRLRAADTKAAIDDALARIVDAERRLDLAGAEAAIDAMAAERGGASPLVARQRDRLHRFGFYLDRVARALPTLARIEALPGGEALGAVAAFVTAVRHGGGGRDDDGGAAVGLRSALATIGSLADEFPHLAGAGPAHAALRAALARLTDDAWDLVAAARQRLQAVPVPVRPLQLTLGRLDTLRLLEALVDRPDRPRSQLLDQIEALRVALDQARSARDRLAQSAESAIARGHWTTGLFDMERAVARIEPGDDAERGDAARLQERLASARRRKQEIDAAMRRNVDLAARCAALADDPTADARSRQQALADRRDCLLFLTMHVPQDRSELYRRDLREVDVQLALARADDAEAQFAGAATSEDRARRARAAAEELADAIAALAADGEPPGRLLRAQEHWRAVAAQCQRAIDDERTLLQHQRRRRWLAAALVLVAAAAAAGLTMWLRG
jgi:hypothetical protein